MSVHLAIAITAGGFVLSAGCGSQSNAPIYDSGVDAPANSDASAEDASAGDAVTASAQCSVRTLS
jgi:hypothetical protein